MLRATRQVCHPKPALSDSAVVCRVNDVRCGLDHADPKEAIIGRLLELHAVASVDEQVAQTAELMSLKLSELRGQALAAGVRKDAVDDVRFTCLALSLAARSCLP